MKEEDKNNTTTEEDKTKETLEENRLEITSKDKIIKAISSIIGILIVFYAGTYILSSWIAPHLEPKLKESIYDSKLLNRTDNISSINLVKNHTSRDSNVTVGEGLDEFFSDPKWEYDQKQRNVLGQDTTVDVVTFTGKCKQNEKEVDAKILFYISNGDVSSAVFYIDDQELSAQETWNMINSIYKDNKTQVSNDIKQPEQKTTVPVSTQVQNTTTTQNTNKKYDVSKIQGSQVIKVTDSKLLPNLNDSNDDIINKFKNIKLNNGIKIDNGVSRFIEVNKTYKVYDKDKDNQTITILAKGKNNLSEYKDTTLILSVDIKSNTIYSYGASYAELDSMAIAPEDIVKEMKR